MTQSGTTIVFGNSSPIRLRAAFIATTFAFLAHASAPAQSPNDDGKLIKKARDFARSLAEGDTKSVSQSFDPTMAQAMPPEKLKELWETLQAQAGPFKSFGPSSHEHQAGFDAVFVETNFRDKSFRLKVVFDQKARISGLWVEPVVAPSAPSPPSYDEPDKYTVERVEFGDPKWLVKGILTRPKTRALAPAVVLVHGSGPLDADETIGPNKPFRDLAAGLSSNGIAVLRYPKRTNAYRLQLAVKKTISLREEVIEDALAALAFLRTQPTIDKSRIFLLGHSLGATMGPLIAMEDNKLAGLIMMSGSGRDFFDVIEKQLAYIAGLEGPKQPQNAELYQKVQTTIAQMRAGKLSGDARILDVPVSYWQELSENAAESLRALEGLGCRVLILGGGRDYQVTREDFDLYKRLLKDDASVTLKWMPQMNHIYFRGKGMSKPNDYGIAGHVDGEVISLLTKWINDG